MLQSARKLTHSTPWWSKHLATSSQDSQHRLTVPVRQFLHARRAVQATNSSAPRVVGAFVRIARRALTQARNATSLIWSSAMSGSASYIMFLCSSPKALMNKGCCASHRQMTGWSIVSSEDSRKRAGRRCDRWDRFIANYTNCVGMALKVTQISHLNIDENAINARQRADGAVTPHVLEFEEKLNNHNREGEGSEKSGSTASITIAQYLGTRVGPTLGWVTNVEITNEKPNTVEVCWPECCRSTNSSPEFLWSW